MGEKREIKGYIEDDKHGLRVGGRKGDYTGPIARITWDEDWLHIVTDDYEGHAMLNIETLPFLRRALTRVAKRIRAGKTK
jgi:hypothetical protein